MVSAAKYTVESLAEWAATCSSDYCKQWGRINLPKILLQSAGCEGPAGAAVKVMNDLHQQSLVRLYLQLL